MNNIVELSSGHVFAAGSVKAITPVTSIEGGELTFKVIGVGYIVNIYALPEDQDWNKQPIHALRQEAIDKLLKGQS